MLSSFMFVGAAIAQFDSVGLLIARRHPGVVLFS